MRMLPSPCHGRDLESHISEESRLCSDGAAPPLSFSSPPPFLCTWHGQETTGSKKAEVYGDITIF